MSNVGQAVQKGWALVNAALCFVVLPGVLALHYVAYLAFLDHGHWPVWGDPESWSMDRWLNPTAADQFIGSVVGLGILFAFLGIWSALGGILTTISVYRFSIAHQKWNLLLFGLSFIIISSEFTYWWLD